MSHINSSFRKRWGGKRSNKDNGESVNCDAHSSGISYSKKKKEKKNHDYENFESSIPKCCKEMSTLD